MSVVAQECCVLASVLESRRGRTDPFEGLAEAFFGKIQPLLEAPWAVAMNDLVYSQTRGQRPPDFETRIQYARALMRLAAEDYETDKIVFEVRALLKPQSALREPELASRVMSMMDRSASPIDHNREATSVIATNLPLRNGRASVQMRG